MSRENKLRMARLAKANARLAELAAEEARLRAEISAEFSALADGEIDVVVGRKSPTPHRPRRAPLSELDRRRADSILRDAETNRRLRS
jgi:hypothetical protein